MGGRPARLPAEAERYFRLDWAGEGETSAAGFRVLAITEGTGRRYKVVGVVRPAKAGLARTTASASMGPSAVWTA